MLYGEYRFNIAPGAFGRENCLEVCQLKLKPTAVNTPLLKYSIFKNGCSTFLYAKNQLADFQQTLVSDCLVAK